MGSWIGLTYGFKGFVGQLPALVRGKPSVNKREFDVLEGRGPRQQVECLEYETD